MNRARRLSKAARHCVPAQRRNLNLRDDDACPKTLGTISTTAVGLWPFDAERIETTSPKQARARNSPNPNAMQS
jgi:hypothetical protein